MKKYLIAGLLVWLPLAVTIWVLATVLGLLDGVFGWLLERLAGAAARRAATAFIEMLRTIPGLGVLVMLVALFLTGVFATNIVGQWGCARATGCSTASRSSSRSTARCKQVSDTLFSSSGNAFREAVLVEYPRAGAWTIAFVTGKPGGEAAAHLAGDYLSIYVPTTPNPTSGFFLMVPRAEVIPLAMSVDEALKYVISMGVVAPPLARRGRADAAAAAKFDRLSARQALSPTAARLRPLRPRAT